MPLWRSALSGETSHSFFTLPDEIQRENYPLLAPGFLERDCGKLKQLQPGKVQSWLGVHVSEKVQTTNSWPILSLVAL